MSLKERFVVLAFKAGWWTGKYLPEKLMRSIFRFFGQRFFASDGPSIKRLKFNLSRVVNAEPDSSEVALLASQSVDSYFRYWCEMFRIANWKASELSQRTRVINENIPLDLIASGSRESFFELDPLPMLADESKGKRHINIATNK